MPRHLAHNVLLVVASLAALVACGGGSGSSSSATSAPKGLSYGQGSFALLLGAPIDALVPKVNGKVNSWSISAPLPPGLAFDADTGVISGSPTEVTSERDYTVRATNGQGLAAVTFDLRIAAAANFAYVSSGDGTVASFAVDAQGGQLFHHGFAQDPLAEHVPERPVIHPLLARLYVPNLGDGLAPSNISIFEALDDGRLSPLPPVAVGVGPHELALRDDGATAYVSCTGSDDMYPYQVDPVSGELTLFPSGPIQLGDNPMAIVVDAKRRFVYVSNRASASISIIILDLVTGEPMGQLPEFSLNGGVATDLGVDPSGRLLYATLGNFDKVLALVIDELTGELTVVGGAATGAMPTSLAVHPDGEHLLVTNQGDDTVSAYAVDLGTGTVTAGALAVGVGKDPVTVTIEDSGAHAFVSCRASHELTPLDLADPMAPVASMPWRSRRFPLGMALLNGGRPVQPRARGLYAMNVGDATVSTFSVRPGDGDLTELGAPHSVGAQPSDLSVDPFGRFVWVASADDDGIQAFTIDQGTGGLTAQGLPTPTDADPAGLAVDPSGRVLFVTSTDTDRVTSFSIDPSDGTLTPLDASSAGAEPSVVSVDPTGQFVITANQSSGTLTVFPINSSGSFSGQGSSAAAPGHPSGLHWSPRGALLFVALTDADHVVPYRLDSSGGTLELQHPGAAVQAEPWALVPHPSSTHAYAPLGGPGSGGLGFFTLDEDGNPTLAGNLVNVGLDPADLMVDPAGAFLLSANLAGDDIARFSLSSAGAPTFVELTPAGDSPLVLGLLRRIE